MHLTIQANEKDVATFTLLSLGRQIEMRETRSVTIHRTIDSATAKEFETLRREIWIKTNGHPARMCRKNHTIEQACRDFVTTFATNPHADLRDEFNQLFASLNHYAI